MKERNIVWADAEHIADWESHLLCLEDEGYKLTRLKSRDNNLILVNCSGKDLIVIHSGTQRPFKELEPLLKSIRQNYPTIKIALQTNAIHPAVESLVDFYIPMPITVDQLFDILQRGIAGGGSFKGMLDEDEFKR